jgi:hypothetical protein
LGDPISKIPNTKKGWQSGSSGKSICLASVQTPVPPKRLSTKDLANPGRDLRNNQSRMKKQNPREEILSGWIFFFFWWWYWGLEL